MAGEFLRALFCAAALTGGDLRTVAAWATGFEITTAQEVLRLAGRDQFAQDLEQMRGEARKTIETIQMTMRSRVCVPWRPAASGVRAARRRLRAGHPDVSA